MKQRIIVVGGGFAGIQLVRNLKDERFEILLLDKLNHHQFQPLFYQVATSQLEPSSISFPLRSVFRNRKNLQIRMSEVLSVDIDKNRVTTTDGFFDYDILVLAMGCTTNFYGNEGIARHAFPLKSTYDAIRIRNHILQIFEDVLFAPEEEREAMLCLVIAGAGPTGVELAGAFSEIKNEILPGDYPGIDFSKFRILLVEGSGFTLATMSHEARENSLNYLKKMGVEVRTEILVKNYDGKKLELSNGEILTTKTLIWAAGVAANRIEGLPTECITKGNRILVNRQNRVEGTSTIYVIGDMACMQTPLYPNGHPQVANVAINQARLLAKNLNRRIDSKPYLEFEYKDLGSMATIGRNKAVVDLPFWKFKGYLAWLVWMFLHLMLILSVRNKLIIFINWAWAYVTKDTSLRLILKEPVKEESKMK